MPSEKRVELLSGTLELTVAGRTRTLGPVDVAVVPTGMPHRWRNAGDGELHYVLGLDLEGPGCFPPHGSARKAG